MKLIKLLTLSLFAVFLWQPLYAESIRLPYFCGFENEGDTAGWVFKSTSEHQNAWYIGDAVSCMGEKSLFVSSDSAKTASYVKTSKGYNIVAYRKFSLPPGTYDLSFDTRIGGVLNTDYMGVSWIPVSIVPEASDNPTTPAYYSTYKFTNAFGKNVFYDTRWKNQRGSITVTGGGATEDFYLAFYWRTNNASHNSQPAACVDNIRITKQVPDSVCSAIPRILSVVKGANGYTVTWKGKADSYDLEYFNVMYTDVMGYNMEQGITSTSDTVSHLVPFESMVEGVYSFRVRSICGGDTSIWEESTDHKYYDPTAHCLDFTDLHSANVVATTGGFANPYQTVGVVDYGPSSISSSHTVHYMGEKDTRTGNKLTTVPPGEVASVRLGNWRAGAKAESLTYTYRVPAGSNIIMLMKYAVVLEAPGHGAHKDPRFTLEIMDSADVILDAVCTRANFWADKTMNGKNGWSLHGSNLWKDWTSIGVNLSAYAGQTVKIRFTTRDCSPSAHFGYAYFTLGCTEAKITGLSCGIQEETSVNAPDGFNYEWYRADNPGTILGTDRNFRVEGTDTNVYNCDVIYKETAACRFTLSTSMSPRLPYSEFTATNGAKNCQNYLTFDNLSRMVNMGGTMIDSCETYQWDFGNGRVSYKKIPDTVYYPLTGGTYTIKLVSGVLGYQCLDTSEVTVNLPNRVGAKTVDIKRSICDGDTAVVNGKKYTMPGIFNDTLDLKTHIGCDSVLLVEIVVYTKDTTITTDTVCDAVEWKGQSIVNSGTYTHMDYNFMGCDSMYYEHNVLVNRSLQIDMPTTHFSVCADDNVRNMPFEIVQGNLKGYKIDYSKTTRDEGFEDTDTIICTSDDNAVIIMPEHIISNEADSTRYTEPGNYAATITFFNDECGNVEVPISFDVDYPRFIIAQRWNDVIALKNEHYNGGHKFEKYQWYKNDQLGGDFYPIEGETASIIYIKDGDLDFDAEYKLGLQRAGNTTLLFTCPIQPEEYSKEDVPNISFTNSGDGTKTITSSARAVATLYNLSGKNLATFNIEAGDNLIEFSVGSGVYVLKLEFEDGTVDNLKVII